MMKRIVVPTDRSEEGAAGLEEALLLADKFGAEVHVLHVLQPTDPGMYVFRHAEAEHDPLDSFPFLSGVSIPPGVKLVTARAIGERVPESIVRYAEDEAADLIVLGTREHRGLEAFFMGSVPTEVIRESPIPVLTVRSKQERRKEWRHILVPVDFAEHSDIALRVAHDLSGEKTLLSLLYVAEEHIVPVFYDTGLPSLTTVRQDDDSLQRAEPALRALYASIDPTHSAGFHVRQGRPADHILHFCEEEDVDLVVLTSHGTAGKNRFTLGSVADRIIRKTHGAVLVLKPFGRVATL